MSLLLTFAGCIVVSHTVEFEDSGMDSGLRDDFTFTTEFLTADEPCTSDSQCPGAFACVGSVSTSTDSHGCVERCQSDWDCKAGSLCLDDGTCG